MRDLFRIVRGDAPLIVSIPHDGRHIPADIADTMTEQGRNMVDNDWYVNELYDFAEKELGASIISANYSRYVVDLNRPTDGTALYQGQLNTGVCPVKSFSGKALYREGFEPGNKTIAERVERFWHPVHTELQQLITETVKRHRRAVLWDAHSIAREVPSLFRGPLHDLNVGTFKGKSCDPTLIDNIMSTIAANGQFSSVLDGRFVGGYTTRHYGSPNGGVHTVQMELTHDLYRDEDGEFDATRARPLQELLRDLLQLCRDY